MASQDQWISIIETPNGSTATGLLASDDDLAIEKDIMELPDVAHRQVRDFKEGRQVGGGSVTLRELSSEDGVGSILYGLFGEVSTSGSYVHTFTPEALGSSLPKFDIVKNLGSVQEIYEEAKINEVSITTPASGEADIDFGIVAKRGKKTSGETEASYDESTVFNCADGSVFVGGSAFNVANIELSFTNNVSDADETFAIDGSEGRAQLPEGDFGLELSLDVIADSSKMIDDFVGGSSETVTLDLGDTPNELKFTIPNAIVSERGKHFEVEGGVIIEDVSMIALYDTSGSSDLCKAELTNSIASYPR